MSEEEIFKMLLVESIDKYPLLNELFAIRDSRGKRNDYTIFVNGYISLDVINKAIEKVNLLNNLKEIEKTHKEENGKLRVEFEKVYEDNLTLAQELEQEKEKNKGLEEKLKIAVAMLTKGTYPEKNEGDNDFDKQFIAVDKIKEKIEYQNMLWNTPNRQKEYNQEVVEVLEELLEEV